MTDATAAADVRHLSAVPDADEDDIDETKEGLDLRDNGTVRLYLDGTRYRLRRPRAREFRRLREAFQEAADEISDLSDDHEAWKRTLDDAVDKRRADDPRATMTPEERKENRERGRQQTEQVERLMFEWWAEVIEVLEADGRTPVLPVPDDTDSATFDRFAEMPMWMGTVPSAGRIIGHWRAVPSPSGGR